MLHLVLSILSFVLAIVIELEDYKTNRVLNSIQTGEVKKDSNSSIIYKNNLMKDNNISKSDEETRLIKIKGLI